MPGFERDQKRRRAGAAALLAVVIALITGELISHAFRAFWAARPLTAAFVGFATTLALTVLLIEGLLQRRADSDWAFVAQTAFSKLSGEALLVCAGLCYGVGFDGQAERIVAAFEAVKRGGSRPGAGAPPLLPEGFEKALSEVLHDDELGPEFGEALGVLAERLDDAMARWAPVMLRSQESAKALNIYAAMQDMLALAANCLEEARNSQDAAFQFWNNLRVYFLLFAGFDNLRRQARREPLLFGRTAEAMDRAWGLPFTVQVPYLRRAA
jgi:hypothetical protein